MATMMTSEEVMELIRELSFEYKFNANEAIQKYIKKKENNILTDERMDVINTNMDIKDKPKTGMKQALNILMPFTGQVNEELCQGIRRNYDLFSQCSNNKMKEKEYCKTCQKNADKNNTAKPPTGDIKDRLEVGLLDYTDPKTGKKVISYIQYLNRQKIPKEDALNEADRLGFEIPDILMVESNRKRGRVPKKDGKLKKETKKKVVEKKAEKVVEKEEKVVEKKEHPASDIKPKESSNVDEKNENNPVKKETVEPKRGRPKKEKIVSNEYNDYMEIIQSQEDKEIKENQIIEDTTYDKNTLLCQRIKYQGNEYLMTDDYQVYDKHTKEYLGKYNDKEKRVEFLEDIESEEEED